MIMRLIKQPPTQGHSTREGVREEREERRVVEGPEKGWWRERGREREALRKPLWVKLSTMKVITVGFQDFVSSLVE